MLASSFKHKKEYKEILVSKKIVLLFIIIQLSHCSFYSKSSFWNKKEIKEDVNKKEIFKDIKVSNFEINSDLEIDIESLKFTENSFQNNLTNNNGKLNYDGKLKKILKYKFSKIDKFDEFEPEIIFDKSSLIFFSNKGSILKFDDKTKLIWEKNYYTKSEKKLKPILFFANNKEILIVADNISKVYAININSGELLWSTNNPTAFNSEIKINKNYFFLIDYQNILRCFSIKDGSEIWKFQTENSILKSSKKLSLVIQDNKIIFNNSIGDITAVDIKTGNLLWLVPTQKNTSSTKHYFLKNSNLILNKDSVYVSNNQNEFYSIDIDNGVVNWIQNISSSLRSTIIGEYLFSISDNGYLAVMNSKTGEIIRRTHIFSQFKKDKIKATGFIVGKNKIYISVNNGKILVASIKSGKIISSIKIDNEYISRPFILNKNMFVIKENGIIKVE